MTSKFMKIWCRFFKYSAGFFFVIFIVLMITNDFWYGPDKLYFLLGPVGRCERDLGNPDPAIRIAAAVALGDMGSDAVDAVPKLIEQLNNDLDPLLRNSSATALSKIGEAAVPALIKQLESTGTYLYSKSNVTLASWKARVMDNEQMAIAVIGVLKNIKVSAKDAVPHLIPMLEHPSLSLRSAARTALIKLSPDTDYGLLPLPEVEPINAVDADTVALLGNRHTVYVGRQYGVLTFFVLEVNTRDGKRQIHSQSDYRYGMTHGNNAVVRISATDLARMDCVTDLKNSPFGWPDNTSRAAKPFRVTLKNGIYFFGRFSTDGQRPSGLVFFDAKGQKVEYEFSTYKGCEADDFVSIEFGEVLRLTRHDGSVVTSSDWYTFTSHRDNYDEPIVDANRAGSHTDEWISVVGLEGIRIFVRSRVDRIDSDDGYINSHKQLVFGSEHTLFFRPGE